MFDVQSGTHHRRPGAFPVKLRKNRRRVRVRFQEATFDLFPEEAMAFANRLVDSAEEVIRHEDK